MGAGIIPNDKNITVASNELFLRATINRNLEKLVQNDVALLRAIEAQGTNEDFSIQAFRETRIYSVGEVVIYTEYDKKSGKVLNVYLLRCIADNNLQIPSYDVVDGFVKDFSKSGWESVNPLFPIFNSDDPELNLSSFLEYSISSKFHLSHEIDVDYHPLGQISASTMDEKILKTDFSNIADTRPGTQWAYETKKVSGINYSGMCKKWGNGVLEYDLTYCLGDSVVVGKVLEQDGTIKTAEYIKANSLIPLSDDECCNDDYFLDRDSYGIFNKKGSGRYYSWNGIGQTNTTEQVNEYHGTIVFPIPFADRDYMVFTSGTAADENGLNQSPNAMAFVNRKRESITAVLVIPNYNALGVENVILKRNVFQCQIIGRWKK